MQLRVPVMDWKRDAEGSHMQMRAFSSTMLCVPPEFISNPEKFLKIACQMILDSHVHSTSAMKGNVERALSRRIFPFSLTGSSIREHAARSRLSLC